MYTLLYLKWITNKDLLFVLAQETLLNVMWQPGWEGNLGEETCTCMAKSLCSPAETITTLPIGYTQKWNEVLKKGHFKNEGRDLAITRPPQHTMPCFIYSRCSINICGKLSYTYSCWSDGANEAGWDKKIGSSLSAPKLFTAEKAFWNCFNSLLFVMSGRAEWQHKLLWLKTQAPCSLSPFLGFLKIVRYLLAWSLLLEDLAAFPEIIIFFLFYYACPMWHLYFNA